MTDATHHARTLRKRAAELRHEANALIAGAVALEREAWGPNPLRGREIVDMALAVLDRTGPLHYRPLAEQIEELAETRIAGKDRTATLTAALHRDPRVVQLGGGRWGMAEVEIAA